MTKTIKKDEPKKAKKNINLLNKLNGTFELFVVSSIAFMAYVVLTGLNDPVAWALTTPAVLWAVLKLVQKFAR